MFWFMAFGRSNIYAMRHLIAMAFWWCGILAMLQYNYVMVYKCGILKIWFFITWHFVMWCFDNMAFWNVTFWWHSIWLIQYLCYDKSRHLIAVAFWRCGILAILQFDYVIVYFWCATTLSIMSFTVTINKRDIKHNYTKHNAEHCYVECNFCWVLHTSPVCWVSLCWKSLCWISLCWMSLYWMWS